MPNNNAGGAVAQLQNDPIYSLPYLYISGLNISVASASVLAIAPGQARDSTDSIDMPVGFPNLQGNVIPPVAFQNYNQPLFLNAAVTGANGLDAYTDFTISSNYCVYLIADSRGYLPCAGIISYSSNAYPALPSGYDSYRLLGFVTTNGTPAFNSASVLNTAYSKAYYLQPGISVLAGGNATTFTAIDLSSAIPTTTDPFVIASLLVTFTPSSDASTVSFRPTGTTATTNIPTISALIGGAPQQQYLQVLTAVSGGFPSIDYVVSSAADSVNITCVGYAVTLQ